MSRLTISVAICTFNGRRFLDAQLESIAAQSRLPDEIVFCDDGSSDGTAEIIREFSRRTTVPTRLVINNKNIGSTKNFEQAIGLCRGSIVALADQDDVWYGQKLERIEESFARSSTLVAAFSDADLIDDESRPLGSRLWSGLGFDRAKQDLFTQGQALRVLIRHPVVTGATMAFRRELFDFMVPIPTDEFHDRWISFLLACQGRYTVISEPLMQYRRHPAQQVGPGPLTLRGLMIQARSRGADHYLEEIDRFHDLYGRLEERKADFPYAELALDEIKSKLRHLQHRARLPHGKVARIPKVLREVINGHYWRYSGGWRSLAKDMVIR